MLLSEYRTKCIRTLPDLGEKINLCHMALGLSSELQELVACIGTEIKIKIDKVNLGEEIGDMYWYATNYCNLRELPIPGEIDTHNFEQERSLELLIQSIGELSNLVKRYIAYNKPIEKSKELGVIYDLYVSLVLLERIYELDGGIVRQANIDKLIKRYPEKFTNELALNRDLKEERTSLENNLNDRDKAGETV